MSSNLVCNVLVLINILFCECSNIFHESSKIVYRPDRSAEYFGYSVILSDQRYLLMFYAIKIKLQFSSSIYSEESP